MALLRLSGMGTMHEISSKEEFLAREDAQCASISDANDDGEQVSVAPLDWTLEKFGLLATTSPQQLQEPLQKSKRPMRSIDVLKLDCEGCEPIALLGAQRMFAENPPRFVLTEVSVSVPLSLSLSFSLSLSLSLSPPLVHAGLRWSRYTDR